MPSNKQSAKGATFALLATMLRGRFFGRAWNRVPKKKFHFVKTFGLESPVKPSFQKNKHTQKLPTKPYAATLSEVFKT